jgi:hypothetical protein
MLEDKIFLEKEITPNVARMIDTAKIMINERVPLPKIYKYILTHSQDIRETYITLFLFGLAYRWYKEDNHLK